MTAATRAPTRPAAPSCATRAGDALLEVVEAEAEGALLWLAEEGDVDDGACDEAVEVTEPGVEEAVVDPVADEAEDDALTLEPDDDEAVALDVPELPLRQLESVPLRTVKGADWTVSPLESRRVRPREVPAGWVTVQV